MRIVVFGGSFNPPHKGHLNAALAAAKLFCPDRFLVMPAFLAPHKEPVAGSASPKARVELCRLCFAAVPGAEVSEMEIFRGGKSYTADTLRELKAQQPDAELILLVGSDMLQTLENWHEAEYIMRNAVIGAFPRERGELGGMQTKAAELKQRWGADIRIIPTEPFSAASGNIRDELRQRGGTGKLTDAVYSYIVRNRLYDVKVNYPWLRQKSYAMLKPRRVPHVRGCEEEAIRLAERWGADRDQAAEAAILHDITKKELLPEQLLLCEKYGIIPDELEMVSGKLLHAKTGAAIAEHVFGADEAVCSAIRWHTTGRPDMSLLEKVIYMADYIEPNRDFEGVEPLRKLAYEDLDAAMLLGFEMSLEDILSRNEPPHENTVAAMQWYKERKEAVRK